MIKFGVSPDRLRLQCEVLLWRRGYCWALLLVALIVVFVGQFLVLPHQKSTELQAQQQLLALVQGQAEKEMRGRLPVRPSAADEVLDQLLAVAYAEEQVSDVLRRIAKTAQSNGVFLSQSDFQTITDGRGGLTQLQVTLPVRASYLQIRGFVEQVLQKNPGVSLDELILKRDSVAQNQVEVSAKLSLWILPGKTPKATP